MRDTWYSARSKDSASTTVKLAEISTTVTGMKQSWCGHLTTECAGNCEVFPSIKKARVAKTLDYIKDPGAFEERLYRDIHKLIKEAKARGMKPSVRIFPMGTSDLPKLALHMADMWGFRDVQFYDYTKIPQPWIRMRSNYHL